MRIITIHRLSLQFDDTGSGTPKEQARKVVDAINETLLANQGIFSTAQLYDTPDEIEVTVEEKED